MKNEETRAATDRAPLSATLRDQIAEREKKREGNCVYSYKRPKGLKDREREWEVERDDDVSSPVSLNLLRCARIILQHDTPSALFALAPPRPCHRIAPFESSREALSSLSQNLLAYMEIQAPRIRLEFQKVFRSILWVLANCKAHTVQPFIALSNSFNRKNPSSLKTKLFAPEFSTN